MILRPFVLFIALANAFISNGQSCFTVVDAEDRSPVEGCVVRCGKSDPIGVSDVNGLVCLDVGCAQLVLTAQGHATLRIATVEALVMETVAMQREIDTLRDVEIIAWPMRTDRLALASTSSPDSSKLHGFEQSGLRSALVWAPGVQWDERGHGGSQRLSIRGSLLRSAYGVRGVKVYWGPFPLTLADGSTPLELLDPQLVGSVDVVRSVGSPAFGSAPSGLLLADVPWLSREGFRATLDASGGSDGFFKLAASANTRGPNSSLSAGVLRMGNNGYRQQEYANRDQAWIANRLRSKRDVLTTYITGQQARWALPGSVDSLTAINDPRAAREYSRSIDAHIEKKQLFAGIRNELEIGRALKVNSGVHAQLIDKVNPYGTTPAASGYKDEHLSNAGARLSLAQDARIGSVAFAWEAGIEALVERDQLNEHTYANAILGNARTDADTRVRNLNAFAATVTHIGARTTLCLDIGVERTAYDQKDLLRNTSLSTSRPAASYPLFAIERNITGKFSARARYAEAVSRPTVWELLGTTGVFNTTLEAEHVHEWEAGIALGSDTSAVHVDVSGYLRSTEGLITSINDGVNTVYANAGNAQQNGIEVEARLKKNLFARDRIEALFTATFQDHRLMRSGAPTIDVPGVPRAMFGGIVRYEWRKKTTVEIGARYASSVSASLNNVDRVAGYTLMHARISHSFRIGSALLNLFLHAENLLDVDYTAFVWLNDPGHRYYNPAPGRSFFGGINLSFISPSPGR